jgi:hypothetical protein
MVITLDLTLRLYLPSYYALNTTRNYEGAHMATREECLDSAAQVFATALSELLLEDVAA